jgi:hypothetical protein
MASYVMKLFFMIYGRGRGGRGRGIGGASRMSELGLSYLMGDENNLIQPSNPDVLRPRASNVSLDTAPLILQRTVSSNVLLTRRDRTGGISKKEGNSLRETL